MGLGLGAICVKHSVLFCSAWLTLDVALAGSTRSPCALACWGFTVPSLMSVSCVISSRSSSKESDLGGSPKESDLDVLWLPSRQGERPSRSSSVEDTAEPGVEGGRGRELMPRCSRAFVERIPCAEGGT